MGTVLSQGVGLVMGLWEMILECGWGNARILFSPLGERGTQGGDQGEAVFHSLSKTVLA